MPPLVVPPVVGYNPCVEVDMSSVRDMERVAVLIRRPSWTRILLGGDDFPSVIPTCLPLHEQIAREIDAEIIGEAFGGPDWRKEKRRTAWQRLDEDL